MPKILAAYVRIVDRFNRRVGRFVMYGIFVMMAILLWSTVSKAAGQPALWTLEMAQFALVAYYILGGPYSIQLGANVRMDLFYGDWSPRRKAAFDAMTIFLLIFYLGVLLWGALSSTAYSLGHFGADFWTFYRDLLVAFLTGGPDAAAEVTGHMERSNSIWRAYLWPIKLVMILGFFLMLLQAISEFLKDVATLRGVELS